MSDQHNQSEMVPNNFSFLKTHRVTNVSSTASAFYISSSNVIKSS